MAGGNSTRSRITRFSGSRVPTHSLSKTRNYRFMAKMKDLLVQLGISPVGGSPATMAERIAGEASIYRDIIATRPDFSAVKCVRRLGSGR